MTPSLPDWMRRQLEAAGRLDTDGIRRTVSSTTCRSCGAAVLVGLDADRCALTVVADPWPVDVAGEALALLSGRATFDLAGRQRLELDGRDQFRVAGARRWPVLASHLCYAPPLPRCADPPKRATRPPASDVPAF